MKKIYFIVLGLMLILFCTSCNREVVIQGFSMDSPYNIKIKNEKSSDKKEINLFLNNCDQLFSAYDETSQLYKLNETSHITKSKDNELLFDLVSKSLPFCDNEFDISIRQITKMWNFNDENPIPPTQKMLNDALKKTGKENIEVTKNSISLYNGTQIELGAVAKGYVTDKVADMLTDDEGIIDIGGTIKSTYKKDINVGIRSPDKNGIIMTFALSNMMAVSTSGSYERNFSYNNKFYHHILDPKTGMSVENDLVMVSVISDSALKSDVLSTKYFVQGMKHSEIPDDVVAIFVTKDKKITVKGDKNIKIIDETYSN